MFLLAVYFFFTTLIYKKIFIRMKLDGNTYSFFKVMHKNLFCNKKSFDMKRKKIKSNGTVILNFNKE